MRKIKGSPQPFGVDIKGKNINFAVQVAKGKTCELLLYKRGKEVPEYQFDMPEEEGVGEVRFLAVEGLKADRYEYNFLIDGKVCVDPWSCAAAISSVASTKLSIALFTLLRAMATPSFSSPFC